MCLVPLNVTTVKSTGSASRSGRSETSPAVQCVSSSSLVGLTDEASLSTRGNTLTQADPGPAQSGWMEGGEGGVGVPPQYSEWITACVSPELPAH